MPDRQFPKPTEIFELMRFKKPELNAKKRRLDAALTIYDLREITKRRTPKAAFDYTDGAAESEVSLQRARQAFEDIEFHPSILKDVSAVDTSTTVFGGPSALPFGIAPTGFTRLMRTEGETAGAAAAGAAGKFPEATQVVDLYHAREHLHSLTRSLEFMLLDRRDEWLAARLEDLDYGDIDGIEAAVRKYPLEGIKKDEAEKELSYFPSTAPRMRYHWFRSRGLFVGSGAVEASCKTVIGQRLKQSGMHWTVAGADSITALRCREAGSRWETTCNTPDTQTRTA